MLVELIKRSPATACTKNQLIGFTRILPSRITLSVKVSVGRRIANLKIVRPVVAFVAVDMVDVFPVLKATSVLLLGNHSVLVCISTDVGQMVIRAHAN